jgi:signal transduction histidine kinase
MALAALRGVMRKQRDAWFYLRGNAVLWLYLWVQMLYYLGFVPIPILPETFGLYFIAVSLLLFCISTAQQIKLLRREKRAAQEEALSLQQQMTRDLERLVDERTQELSKAKNEAEKANQAKTDFFSHISHDMRAPLNWLIGLAESLWLESRDFNLTSEFQDYLQQIKTGGYYLSQLLNNIMDISSIEAGHNRLRQEKVDLQAWSNSLKAIAEAIARSSKVHLDWNLEFDQHPFHSDPVKLSQILMNLVHNAIKHTPPGKHVHVNLTCTEKQLCMTIADEGEGISQEELKIFDPFVHMPPKPEYMMRGVGLGLHIVNTNVLALKGGITIENQPGSGALFTVKIDGISEVELNTE